MHWVKSLGQGADSERKSATILSTLTKILFTKSILGSTEIKIAPPVRGIVARRNYVNYDWAEQPAM